MSANGNRALCMRGAGEIAGCIDLKRGSRSDLGLSPLEGEVGYWVGCPYWSNGFMPEAVRALARYTFDELGLDRLWADYYEGNDQSRRVLEKCGFVYERTEHDVPLPLLGKSRTLHVMRLDRNA